MRSFYIFTHILWLFTNLSFSNKTVREGIAIKISGPKGYEKARVIGKKYGYEKVTKIGNLDGFYSLENTKIPSLENTKVRSRSKRNLDEIEDERDIEWMEKQVSKIRKKRDLYYSSSLNSNENIKFNDPLYFEQWYLKDPRMNSGLDINVLPVWRKGITGHGIVVTILDDGIEHNHTDISQNYEPKASWDINDDDSDPFPRYDINDENKHGTRCAGEVASVANNNVCGVGVAFNARIGGVRMLDGHVTDKVEASSLSLNPQYIDIYSASWGPNDDGKTVEGPGILTMTAFVNGITKGRGGLGSIYVWASGNGGHHDDDCNCDGYANNIYTLSISSASDEGDIPWYSETCSATLASTLSSGSHTQHRIITTDLHNTCTYNHTGTSASAPLAAGIIALVLEANRFLTWRDVQHLVIYTSNWKALKKVNGWKVNGIGLHFHQNFGFGLLDAEKLITAATDKMWKSCDSKYVCSSRNILSPRFFSPVNEIIVSLYIDGCIGSSEEVNYIEHFQITITLEHNRRGDISIDIISPSGTTSPVLDPRKEDDSTQGFNNWIMTSVHFWGENPVGVWSIKIKDNGSIFSKNTGILKTCIIHIHGTKKMTYYQFSHIYNNGGGGVSVSSESEKMVTPKSHIHERRDTLLFKHTAPTENANNMGVGKKYAAQQNFINYFRLLKYESLVKSYTSFLKAPSVNPLLYSSYSSYTP